MKYTPPYQPSAGARTGTGVPKAVIIEIRARVYIQLSCQHLTNREAQEQYAVFRPRGKLRYFCERCGSWETVQINKERHEPPETPLF